MMICDGKHDGELVEAKAGFGFQGPIIVGKEGKTKRSLQLNFSVSLTNQQHLCDDCFLEEIVKNIELLKLAKESLQARREQEAAQVIKAKAAQKQNRVK